MPAIVRGNRAIAVRRYPWNGVELLVEESVYYPSEDSELLLHSVSIPKNSAVLDLGCGCGIQGFNALRHGAESVLAVDENESALHCATENAKRLGFSSNQWSSRKSHLFSDVPESFDCILFNPPYLPDDGRENPAIDGGKRGREVLDQFLQPASEHLNPNGILFFVHSSLNGWEKTERLLKRLNFSFEIAGRKKLFFEELVVVKAQASRDSIHSIP